MIRRTQRPSHFGNDADVVELRRFATAAESTQKQKTGGGDGDGGEGKGGDGAKKLAKKGEALKEEMGLLPAAAGEEVHSEGEVREAEIIEEEPEPEEEQAG